MVIIHNVFKRPEKNDTDCRTGGNVEGHSYAYTHLFIFNPPFSLA